MNKKYRVTYWSGFYILQERRRFLWIPYWKHIGASYDLSYIEQVWEKLRNCKINQHGKEI